MSQRITVRDLRAVLSRMCREAGIAEGPVWTPRADGRGSEARVGALMIEEGSRTYGRSWCVAQVMNEGGGERILLRGTTASELYYAMHAWLAGFEYARRGDAS